MVEACERRILEFPLDMDAREIAKKLKRQGRCPKPSVAGFSDADFVRFIRSG